MWRRLSHTYNDMEANDARKATLQSCSKKIMFKKNAKKNAKLGNYNYNENKGLMSSLRKK